MSRNRLPIFFILLTTILILALPILLTKSAGVLKATQPYLERIGEEITYEVRFGSLLLGEAKFSYLGKVNLEGRALKLLVFKTRVINFSDTENIYSDPGNFLPIKIEREVSGLLKKEHITENYDQINYRVKITKNNGRKAQQQVIRSDGVIHNAILFPYAVRDLPDLKIGRIFKVNLPNRKLEVKLVSIENLRLAKGVAFEVFHFESTPKQISLWISTDERRIPVKIEGAGFFGYTLLLKDYRL